MRLKQSIASLAVTGAVCAVSVLPVFAASNFKDAEKQFKTAAGEKGAGLSTNDNVEGKAASIIQTALSLLGVVFFILMVYGGFIWMTARGDETQAKKAKDIIIMATIGIIIILLSYAATYFVITQVFKAP
ncbi:MAG: hypothetical protein UX10_C0002G0036 [Candidatus Magasanikbacteria bacterium GW2011_GWA2_45_39]|uniref:Integral membrane protein n=2 Tax=Candidatus Magasanikiibacteriota TaxID=1752731 RepID=A0A0G1MZL7_9BACT|nr:MAG: hypothetical protein UX10_C0002G0036 [Candidatus Magasanikbacteria bacterium GW2011_GWA2_45_39]KKU13669.1 MAG: hypothetical protein UX20_C0016G0017 [Candidatus Magasanikbacteria bacterium GW2011_GWC2_45_8]HBW74259.1 hypothetical protein [Candidatus Magasanikbacteria bacterium]